MVSFVMICPFNKKLLEISVITETSCKDSLVYIRIEECIGMYGLLHG